MFDKVPHLRPNIQGLCSPIPELFSDFLDLESSEKDDGSPTLA
jgi:hypothetical protein